MNINSLEDARIMIVFDHKNAPQVVLDRGDMMADNDSCHPQLGSLNPLAPSGLRPGGFFYLGSS